ncbi:MAG: Mur ligase family protein, partial [Microgenomates group bacterium]
MKLADWHSFYLVGIKGVAMTALAQMLRDMGKHVEGCDVEEEFVTQKILTNLSISIHIGFEHSIPTNTDCVIYTAAHGGISNKIVKSAIDQEMPTFSHAEALGFLFNDKEKRIAVCGVGGKSTVSAMISWVLAKELPTISYSVGVGEIIGLGRNAQWSENSTVFVAEADEYATNPEAVKNGEAIVPRFSYLNPTLLVCTHIRFDHPDVYTNFEHTLQTFHDFFHRIPDPQNIIVSEADAELLPPEISKNAQTVGISTSASLRFQIDFKKTKADNTYATILFKNQEYLLKLAVPGSFNIENAAFAILACVSMGISVEKAISHLESFNSTKRRFEFHGEKLGTLYYDDYAH